LVATSPYLRLLGHWGTTPGLNLMYAHMNRVIVARDPNAIFVAGPGHGGAAVVANTYLEASYTEVYPAITRDENGMRKISRTSGTGAGRRRDFLYRSDPARPSR
jgi:phosphoketolase